MRIRRAKQLVRAVLVAIPLFLQGCLSSLFWGASEQQTTAWGLAVFPVCFQFQVPQYQAYLRGQFIADRLNAETSTMIYGPADFRLRDIDSTDITQGTDLATAIRYTRTRPPSGLNALRFTVAWAGVEGEAVQSGDLSASELEGDFIVRAEVLSLAEHAVTQKMEKVIHHLPQTSIDVANDPFPEVTETIRDFVDQLEQNRKIFKPGAKPDGGLHVTPVLGPAAGYALPNRKSLFTELADLKIESVEREVILAGLTRIIDPGAQRSRQILYSSSPYGLVVTEAEGVAKTAGLHPNDLLLTINGEKLSGRYVLDRHLAIGPSRVMLKRAGEVREVTLAITQR